MAPMRVLLLLVLVTSASAVAMRRLHGETFRASNASNVAGNPTDDPKRLGNRPSFDMPQKFASMWNREDAFNVSTLPPANIEGVTEFAPHGPGIKLVMGIPAVLATLDAYEAHLQTWVTGEGVCQLQHYNQPNCSIFPVFLVGNSTASKAVAANASKFALSLPIPEPNLTNDDDFTDGGNGAGFRAKKDADSVMFLKTITWFRVAAESYKWATHIGKMDLDTYPHFKAILADLAGGPSDATYYGSLQGHWHKGKCEDGFMQGALYIISAALQPCMQPVVAAHCPEEGADFEKWEVCGGRHAGEDRAFGEHLFAAAEAGSCPPLACMGVKARFQHPCCW